LDRFRPFRNGDPPALVELWNGALPDVGAARPLGVHEFDTLVMGRLDFDPQGFIVAERDGHPVGFAHAGFGPAEPDGPSHRPDTELGTVAMLVVEPGPDRADLERELLRRAEEYLRARGAEVLYAGGCYPLNPFYWGLYGGSEFAGILGSHECFRRAVEAAGYVATGQAVLWEADLTIPEVRDPKGPLLRRITRVEVADDAFLDSWWDALALGPFRPTKYRLVSKIDDAPLARAMTWEMLGYRRDGRCRTGLLDLEVEPSQRRKGYGRHLVAEILRHARSQMTEVVEVQTAATNAAAMALYESAGFTRVETATLYRLGQRA
jgi:ribosomal protein S18 acetylase RimI-like enzyme